MTDFEVLYEKYRGLVYGYLHKLCGDRLLCNLFCLRRLSWKRVNGMKKWSFLLCIFLLVHGLSGCILSTVDDLPLKEETIDSFRQQRELVYRTMEELQDLWERHLPHSVSVSLEDTKVRATIYHLAEDGYHLRKTKLELESENLRQLLRKMAKHGIHMDEDGIDFQCGGAGFGPSTAYSGIFYTPAKNIRSLPFFPSGAKYQPDQDYFYSDYSDSVSGNKVEIEQVEEGFFYYRLEY